MPLSDEERKRLHELEEELTEEDHRLAVKLSAGPRGFAFTSRPVIGILVGLLGVALLLVGVSLEHTVIGALGFALMIVGTYRVVTTRRPQDHH